MLGEHVNPYDAATLALLEGTRARFLALGGDPVEAIQRAYATVFGIVQRQAAMLSFVHAFQLLGILFVVLLPLILIMRRPAGRKAPAPAR